MNFKAIETLYHGCRFRSRLEARWAVFFDTLGIPWEYEKEGYVLEGMKYLPDFWLPEQDCFFEVKGQEPTDEEKRKAQLLALYTEKNVCIFYGAIDIPEEFLARLNSIICIPPSVWKYRTSEGFVGSRSSRVMDVPVSILALMQHLSEHSLDLFVSSNGSDRYHAAITIPQRYYAVDNLEDLEYTLQKQLDGLQKYQTLLQILEDEIIKALVIEDDYSLHFESQSVLGFDENCAWLECDRCSKFSVSFPSDFQHYCNEKSGDINTTGRLILHSPRILEAYTAARSARFEFGEKGRQ